VDIGPNATLSIDTNQGFVTWVPNTLGLFSVAYRIYDIDLYTNPANPEPADPNSQRGFIPLDMLFEIQPVGPAPYFYAPFALSVPQSQRIIFFYRGVEGSYPVCARSPPAAINAFISHQLD